MGVRQQLSIALLVASFAACSPDQPDAAVLWESSEAAGSIDPRTIERGRAPVVDAADVLLPDDEVELSIKLDAFEERTGHQFVVVTLPSLHGEDIAILTRDLANRWGIGREEYDDGVVLLVAPNERKVRIAVGYGLESILTDAISQSIMDRDILPRFRAGDMTGGIVGGAEAVMARLGSNDN
jgi:uncharacterized protein